jgi:protoporphyrinogen/coproporphyrinogen III oxidase
MKLRVAVLGGGPSGLAAALSASDTALREGIELSLRVFEAGDRAGGSIGTDMIDGFRVERGADGVLADKPGFSEIVERLDLEKRIVRTLPARLGAYVVCRGRLEPIPEGFSMMAPTAFGAFLKSPVLSWRGKARALRELVVPMGAPRDDESLASFVRRRFGPEVLDRLAQPLISGIYGADPEKLSLRATMPRFLDEEQTSGSVTFGLWRKAKKAREAARGARYGLFASFDQGMQVLVDGLVAALGEGVLETGTEVARVEPHGAGARVITSRGTTEFDRVIVALPGPAAATVVEGIDPLLSRELDDIEHGSCVTVALGYDRPVLDRRAEGYGYVVPSSERRPSIAATFASRKWPGRAPAGKELIRVFLGPHAVAESDEAIRATVKDELFRLTGIDEEPVLFRVRRWNRAMPQYHTGHLARAARVEALARRHPYVFLAGNALHGVGVPDAIRTGLKAGRDAVSSNSGRSA